jgi:hypothetical protein
MASERWCLDGIINAGIQTTADSCGLMDLYDLRFSHQAIMIIVREKLLQSELIVCMEHSRTGSVKFVGKRMNS